MKECPIHIDLITGKTKKEIKCHTHKSIIRRLGHNWHCAVLNCQHAKSVFLLEF